MFGFLPYAVWPGIPGTPIAGKLVIAGKEMRMYFFGLDIGTTSCSACVVSDTGEVLERVTHAHSAALNGGAFEALQEPAVLVGQIQEILETLLTRFPMPGGIGVTGQMHGIVYVDGNGAAVSPLYTWQDGRGGLFDADGTWAQRLSALSGQALSSGYGAVTHFYNACHGLVPAGAASFCTIGDYVAMRLCARRTPLLHCSNAAGIGLYRADENAFNAAVLGKMAGGLFPETTTACGILGQMREIPVAVAIGDNQASFLGAVREEDAVLLNVGTGSQVSRRTAETRPSPPAETRPLGDGAILVGAALCGGKAYAALKDFFAMLLAAAGDTHTDVYRLMGAMLANEPSGERLRVCTQFSGTRENPQARGSICNLGLENFTPQHFTAGVLEGMVEELYALYTASSMNVPSPCMLVGSGNGLRENPYLRRRFEERFGAPMLIPVHLEEAAFGAALFAMTATGRFASLRQAAKIIRYQGE